MPSSEVTSYQRLLPFDAPTPPRVDNDARPFNDYLGDAGRASSSSQTAAASERQQHESREQPSRREDTESNIEDDGQRTREQSPEREEDRTDTSHDSTAKEESQDQVDAQPEAVAASQQPAATDGQTNATKPEGVVPVAENADDKEVESGNVSRESKPETQAAEEIELEADDGTARKAVAPTGERTDQDAGEQTQSPKQEVTAEAADRPDRSVEQKSDARVAVTEPADSPTKTATRQGDAPPINRQEQPTEEPETKNGRTPTPPTDAPAESTKKSKQPIAQENVQSAENEKLTRNQSPATAPAVVATSEPVASEPARSEKKSDNKVQSTNKIEAKPTAPVHGSIAAQQPAQAAVAAAVGSGQEEQPESVEVKPVTGQERTTTESTTAAKETTNVQAGPKTPASLTPPPRDGGDPASLTPQDRTRFVQRVANAFQAASQREGEIRLRLAPPELGQMKVEISVKQGVLTARLETDNAEARQVLLDNLPQLRERLAEQSIKVEKFDVDVRDDAQRQAEQQSDDGTKHGQSRQQPSGRHDENDSSSSDNMDSATTTIDSDQLNIVI